MIAALSNRRFLAYLLCASAADGGFWVALIAQGWLVEQLTHSPLWLGVVAGVGQMPFLLFSILGGQLADRYDRRRLIALTNGAIAVVAVITSVLIALHLVTVWFLLVLAFAAGTMLALEHPIDRAWLYDLVQGKDLGSAIALSSLEWSVARMLGPAIGGAAVALIGVAAGYGAYALFVVPLMVLALVAKTKNTEILEDAPGGKGAMREIVVFSLFVGTFTICVTPYVALLPDIASTVLHTDARGYGALAAAGGIGAIVAAVILAAIGEIAHKGRVVTITVFIGAGLLAAFAFAHTFWHAAILLGAMGAVDTVMYALANTYVQETTDDAHRGRANAIFSLAFLGGIPVGNAILGIVANRFGSLPTLAWSSAVVAVLAIVFWFGARRAREAA